MLDWIIATIKALLNRIMANPAATLVIVSLIDDLKDEGGKMVGVAIANIKSVAGRDDLDNAAKFAVVFNAIKDQFPDAATSLINTVVEAAYRSYMQGKV